VTIILSCLRLMTPVAALAGMLLAAPAASAQQRPLPGPAEQFFSRSISPGLRLEQYISALRIEFRVLDADRDGVLTAADRDRMQQQFAAGMRASAIIHLMSADLDGDGVVTREEVIKYVTSTVGAGAPHETEEARRRRIDREVAAHMQADLNHDGVIDAAEMQAYAKQNASFRQTLTNPALDAALTLATDGKVTFADYAAAAERVFRAVDTDGDGTISQQELDAWRARMRPPSPTAARTVPVDPRQEREAACVMPPVPAGAKLVLIGTYHGTGISTVAIGSQDVTTLAARITIEDGTEPLYVVLVSAAPVIWQFDGAVARVARAVLASPYYYYRARLPGIPAGVTGLAREVVSFSPRGDCINPFADQPTIDAALAVGAVRRRTGQEPAAVVATRQAEHIWLPSARQEHSGEEPPDDMKSMQIGRSTAQLTTAGVREAFARLFPVGVVRIDPAAVIAGQAVEPYQVLPGAAGLLQLLDDGKIVPGKGQELIVRDKIRYPAGLSNSYRILIPKGVPKPDGDASGICVVVEDEPAPPRPGC